MTAVWQHQNQWQQQTRAVLSMRLLVARRDRRSLFGGVCFPLLMVAIASAIAGAIQAALPSLPPPSAAPYPVALSAFAVAPTALNISLVTDQPALAASLDKALRLAAARAGLGDRLVVTPFSSLAEFSDADARCYRSQCPGAPMAGGIRFNSSLAHVNSSNGDPVDLRYTVFAVSGQDARVLPGLATLAFTAAEAVIDSTTTTSTDGNLLALSPSVATFATGASVDAPSQIVPSFIVNGLTFLASFYAEQRVRERDRGLATQIFISGMSPLAFFLATAVIDYLIFLNAVLWTMIILYAFRFRFFLATPLISHLLPCLAYGLAIIPLSYCLSFAFKSPNNIALIFSVSQSLIVFLPYFIVQFIARNVVDKSLTLVLSFFAPSFGLYQALAETAMSVQQPTPMTLSDALNPSKTLTVPVTLLALLQSTLLFMLFALLFHMNRTNKSLWTLIVGDGHRHHHHHRSGDGVVDPEANDDDAADVSAGNTETPIWQLLPDAELAEERHRISSTSSDPALWPDTENLRVESLGKTIPLPARVSKGKAKNLVVLDGLTFSVQKNSCFGFLGPNGAGKSTTIKILCGLEKSTSGRAAYRSSSSSQENAPPLYVTPDSFPVEARARIGMCPQNNALWEKLSAREHVRLYADIRGVAPNTAAAVVEDVLDAVGIAVADRSLACAKLSGGNQRRVMLAVATVGSPQVIFLDEPSTGVDIIIRREIWAYIRRLKTTSTIILTTHSMEEADELSDRIGILVNGSLRCLGTSQRLKQTYGSGYTVNVRGSTSHETRRFADHIVEKVDGCRVLRLVGCSLTLEFTRPAATTTTTATTTTAVKRSASDEVEMLAKVFSALETARDVDGFGIQEFGVVETTLTEIFSQYAKSQKERRQ